VSAGGYGVLQVYDDGTPLDEFQLSLSLPDSASPFEFRPAVLVIANSALDFKQLDSAVQSILMGPAVARSGAASGRRSWAGYSAPSVSLDAEVVGPELLPEKWLDYSGLDFVMVDLENFGKLSGDARRAIVQWVESGGSLGVYNVGKKAGDSAELERLLD